MSATKVRARASSVLVIGVLLTVAVLIGLTGCADNAAPIMLANFVAVAGNRAVTLSWDRVAGADEYRIYRAIAGGVTERIAADITTTATTYADTGLTNGIKYTYTVWAMNDNGKIGDGSTLSSTPGVDSDGDLLIAISSLEQLDNIRHSLNGTAYRDGASAGGVQCGVAADTPCRGYELTRSLDFAAPNSYDSGIVNDAWRPDAADPDNASNPGWVPIGDDDAPFYTNFAGNGNTISNLYARGSGRIGLFGTALNSAISNLGVVAGRLYGGASDDYIGGLVGYPFHCEIVASYASVTIDGGAGADRVGGLVGFQGRSRVVASYATGVVNGGAGADLVGGLVGDQVGPPLSASYATAAVNGGVGGDAVGGLIGQQHSDIVASYATGDSVGGGAAGDGDSVGGLVGIYISALEARTTASYGFGASTGDEAGSGVTPPLPAGVSGANDLTAANAGSEWDDVASFTLGAWDFGTADEAPALRYADYDGSGSVYACANERNPHRHSILIVKCGELLPGQREG